MFNDLPERDITAWLRDPLGRDIAVLTLVVSLLAYLLEPQFNPSVCSALAVGYLIGSLRAQPQASSAAVLRRPSYPRRVGYLLAGAIGGMLVTGVLSMLMAALTDALFGTGHSRYNLFVLGMLIGGMVLGIHYVWRHTRSASE